LQRRLISSGIARISLSARRQPASGRRRKQGEPCALWAQTQPVALALPPLG